MGGWRMGGWLLRCKALGVVALAVLVALMSGLGCSKAPASYAASEQVGASGPPDSESAAHDRDTTPSGSSDGDGSDDGAGELAELDADESQDSAVAPIATSPSADDADLADRAGADDGDVSDEPAGKDTGEGAPSGTVAGADRGEDKSDSRDDAGDGTLGLTDGDGGVGDGGAGDGYGSGYGASVEELLLVGLPDDPEGLLSLLDGSDTLVLEGSLSSRGGRRTYTVAAGAGQAFTATLDAPFGAWLDVRLGDHVLVAAEDRTRIATGELPATGNWKVSVVSSRQSPIDYKLTVVARSPSGHEMNLPGDPIPVVPLELPHNTGQNVMYLTFDDGPNPVYTPQILDVLAKHQAKATFFVLGSLVEAHPRLVQRIVDEGHTIGNHTWNHEDLTRLSREDFDRTVGNTQTLLGDKGTPCLRPPYGARNATTRQWAAQHGLGLALWNVDPTDWRQPPAQTIADHIVQRAQPGAVVLLHDGGGFRDETVQAVDLALQALADSGLSYESLCTYPKAPASV